MRTTIMKPSPAQMRVLTRLREGRNPTEGLTEPHHWGGYTNTLRVLHRRGWIDGDGRLTEKGRKAIDRGQK